MKLSLTLLLTLGLAIGCSSEPDDPDEVTCADEVRADTYAAGMSKVGGNGVEVVLVDATPTPPDRGDNSWTIQIVEAGAPTSGLTLEVVPFMPDHGHGTPKIAEIVDTGADGIYDVTTVNLWMPGLWEVAVNTSDDEGLVDTTTFAFCIDG